MQCTCIIIIVIGVQFPNYIQRYQYECCTLYGQNSIQGEPNQPSEQMLLSEDNQELCSPLVVLLMLSYLDTALPVASFKVRSLSIYQLFIWCLVFRGSLRYLRRVLSGIPGKNIIQY